MKRTVDSVAYPFALDRGAGRLAREPDHAEHVEQMIKQILLTSPGEYWFYWPMLGWGLGLAAHGVATYADAGDVRERMIDAELKRLRERG